MFSKIKNLIEYTGLADELPILDNPSCFKQFCFHESLLIPEVKPDILKIAKVVSDLCIIDNRVIRTPKATSLEGQKLTGFKLMIDGVLNQNVEYVCETPSQAVHAVQFNVPFSTFIILPESFKPSTTIKVAGYIEDISANVINKRNIFINATLLIVADYYVFGGNL